MTEVNFPYGFDSAGRTASTDLDNHVRDMIELLLFTNPGERVMRPGFGSGAMQLVFAPNSPELRAALQFTVQAALQQWLGDVIELQDLEVEGRDSELHVTIAYSIRSVPGIRQARFSRTV